MRMTGELCYNRVRYICCEKDEVTAMEGSIPAGGTNFALQIAIVIVSMAFVAFFSSSEAALISVSKIRLRSLADKGHRGAQAALRVVSNHDKLFATILLTENAFIILASSLGTALALRALGAGGEYIAALVMTIVLVTFGEITPKTYAAGNAEQMALIEGRLIEIVMKIMTIPTWLLTRVTNLFVAILSKKQEEKPPLVTADELRMLIEIGGKEGAVLESEREMLQAVFELRDRRVNEVMIPRTQIVAVQEDEPLSTFLQEFAHSRHARFPVYRDSLDDIVGFVAIKDVLLHFAGPEPSLDIPIKELMRKSPIFAPESKRISELFTEMRDKQVQLAIIIDEFGGTAGLVTLEELVEEVVGQLRDELVAARPLVRQVDAQTYRVNAQMRIEEVNDALGTNLPESRLYETLAGMLLTLMQRIPEEGDEMEARGLKFKVTRTSGLRIDEVEIHLPKPPAHAK